MKRWLPGHGLVDYDTTLSVEQIEHVAVYAAEHGDADLEVWCDVALSCGGGEWEVDNNPAIAEWLELGRNTGYRRRPK